MLLIATVILSAQPPAVPTIVIDRDNIEITQSCRVRIEPQAIIDGDDNGVIHITGSDIAVEFVADSPPLHGTNAEQLPDSFTGTGIVITGRNVTLSGVKVSGFKVGIHAKSADRLTIHHADVSGNFAQHLKSTPQAEDGGDWLWPHNNDDNEWITNYGAGLCIEDSKDVTLHDIRARRTQNGIILDAVNDSKVYDCDCSFLSGWGLAMWRSSRNVISRNAFDFCIRGYSHGVYNRGQDSAGILIFEQCCENVIAENSCTHGGDGVFGFAGKEALGETNPREDLDWYKWRGSNDNWFVENDFSFAAAHGLEMTFSYRNWIVGNLFKSNAITGVWAGYTQGTCIRQNVFASNGTVAQGAGVCIEHGAGNRIDGNTFADNVCDVRLWCDEDSALRKLPWARANYPKYPGAQVFGNRFQTGPIALELRSAGTVEYLPDQKFELKGAIDADAGSVVMPPPKDEGIDGFDVVGGTPEGIIGSRKPVGARAALAGRENIIMTEWGPWDHESPLLQFVRRFDGADEYRLLGAAARQPLGDAIQLKGVAEFDVEGDLIRVRANSANTLVPYELICLAGEDAPPLTASGLLTGGHWDVKTFASPADPRQDVETWRKAATDGSVHTLTCDPLDLPFGNGGMTEVRGLPIKLPANHFGVIATRTLTFPKGKWRIDTTSDDGIRVWMDEQAVIDDWTLHVPTKHSYEFEVAESREIKMRVEYFELDGFASLQVQIVPRP